GLMYHGARYAAPGLARWLSCDPAIDAPAASPYEFASSNPMRYVDRTGRSSNDSDPPDPPKAPEPPPAPAEAPAETRALVPTGGRRSVVGNALRVIGILIGVLTGQGPGPGHGPLPDPASPLERSEETDETHRKVGRDVKARDAVKRKTRGRL